MINTNAQNKKNNIFDIDFNIKIEEFVKFYIKVVDRNLNHLGTHSKNAQIVCDALAGILKINSPDKQILKYGALLHDIGKLFVPAEILNSSRPLSQVEFEIIKSHTIFGYEALSLFISLPEEVGALAISHHHRHGFGYPKHFMYSFKVNPLLIDILTVADSFAAIMEPRVYKKSVSESEAFRIMNDPENEKNAGLNPDVMERLWYLVENGQISLYSFF